VTRSEILEILKKYKIENAEKYGISNIGLFGSYSKDKGHDKSDIDIIVETEEPDLFTLGHIKDELEKLLHTTVDIVRKREKMNPYLKKHIEKDAIYV
jgi:predicted nucleotidyltransferase